MNPKVRAKDDVRSFNFNCGRATYLSPLLLGLSIHLSLHLSIHLSIHLQFTYLSNCTYLFTYLSTYLFTCFFTNPFTYPFTYYTYLSNYTCLFTCLFTYPFTYLSTYLCVLPGLHIFRRRYGYLRSVFRVLPLRRDGSCNPADMNYRILTSVYRDLSSHCYVTITLLSRKYHVIIDCIMEY